MATNQLLDSVEVKEIAAKVRKMVQDVATEVATASGVSLEKYAEFAASERKSSAASANQPKAGAEQAP